MHHPTMDGWACAVVRSAGDAGYAIRMTRVRRAPATIVDVAGDHQRGTTSCRPPEDLMRIAFVSQPFDAVAPDALNSVGLVTHHLATELALEHDVTVYASLGCRANAGAWTGAEGVTYRL